MTRSSGKGTRKRVTGGGVWYNPFTWGKETNDPIAQSTSIVPQNNTETKQSETKQSETTPPNKTLSESIFGTKPEEVKQDTTNQSTKPTTKPWYQFWGGKTRKSKSKNKNTRKSSK